ncbi:MAG: hypothetical protein LBJ64_02860 [Deltaproteobacteria bacterium]|jgi:hypothetical protein|nr:hypothetical protein [Deltaproteobacteria bacterium]
MDLNPLKNLFAKPQKRRAKKTRAAKTKSWDAGLKVPRSLNPANIISSVVNRNINKVVRNFINSIFKK